MRKRTIGVSCVAVAFVVVLVMMLVLWMVPRNIYLFGLVEHFKPGLVPSSSHVGNLNSGDPELMRESLALLKRRKDPSGVADALPLLKHTDDYVWLNAALYTGAHGRKEAVPYLIKALRHSAWRSDPETIATLKALTGEDFGGDFLKWKAWWVDHHPSESFDWTSFLGSRPRVPVTPRI